MILKRIGIGFKNLLLKILASKKYWVKKKLVSEKCIGTGFKKIWYRFRKFLVSEKESVLVSKKFGIAKSIHIGIGRIWYRKSIGFDIKKIGIGKSFGFGFVQIFGFVTHCQNPWKPREPSTLGSPPGCEIRKDVLIR